ncbi:HNH endonuclease [Thermoactinomyces sp. CICC 10523]|nr:HNH endonuclease [Thermoactinomyces sp. CICC 10523]
MQLVKSRVHGNIRHTGGRQIWGADASNYKVRD